MASQSKIPKRQVVWMGAGIATCDMCYVRAQDIPTQQLLNCAKCRVAKYCSKACQKSAWNAGGHKKICDRIDEDRRFSSYWNKSQQREDVVTALLTPDERASEWVLHNAANLFVIACTALRHEPALAEQYVASTVVLRITDRLPKNDDREFYVGGVTLEPKEAMEKELADRVWRGGMTNTKDAPAEELLTSIFVHSEKSTQRFNMDKRTLALHPPVELTLHHFIAYVNRGISFFNSCFLPPQQEGDLPRDQDREGNLKIYVAVVMSLCSRAAPEGASGRGYEIGTIGPDGVERPLLSWDAKGKILKGVTGTKAEKDAKYGYESSIMDSDSDRKLMRLAATLHKMKGRAAGEAAEGFVNEATKL